MSSGKMGQKEVMEFLAKWRPLECASCELVFGFQHRASGAMYCISGCHQQCPSPASTTEKPLLPAATLKPDVSKADAPAVSATTAAVGNGMKSDDATISKAAVVRKQSVAPMSIPATTPKSTIAPTTKPAEPKPEPSKVATKRYMWSELKYSDKLLSATSPVHVLFVWGPITYHVAADADEDPVKQLQVKLNSYVKTAKKMDRPPVVDELAIGDYDGEYYRARVVKVNGDECELQFIDFGDKKLCKYSEVFPVNDELMKIPVYGLMIQLKMPMPVDNLATLDKTLEDSLYLESYLLDFNKKAGPPVPGNAEYYEVRLWDLDKENTINEKLTSVLSSHARCTEEDEIVQLLAKSSHFRESKKLVEEYMGRAYIFKLDNVDYLYRIQDLQLPNTDLLSNTVRVEITEFRSLNSIIAAPLGGPFDEMRSGLSGRIGRWMSLRNKQQRKDLVTTVVPEYEQMCLVQWPSWATFSYNMERLYGKTNWKTEITEMHRFWFFKEDFRNYEGKWFRAACRSKLDPTTTRNKHAIVVLEMLLVDLGKTILIPHQYVYKMPHRFMIDPQAAIFITVHLDDIQQYDDTRDNEKWKYLLLPGMKLKIKIVWMIDEINVAKLVSPSESDFNKHFLNQQLQKAIQARKHSEKLSERHRNVQEMPKIKGMYEKNMEKVIKEEEELAKLKPFQDEYAQIGRVHPHRIFELCLAN